MLKRTGFILITAMFTLGYARGEHPDVPSFSDSPSSITLSSRESPQSKGGQNRESFSEFRKGLFEDYNKFRNSILEDYDRFLSEAWENYQQIKGEDRYQKPKPHRAPSVEPAPQPEVPTPQPAYPIPKPVKPDPRPVKPDPQPVKPVPQPAVPVPQQPASSFRFPYFGMEVSVRDKVIDMGRPLGAPTDYGARWREMSRSGAESIIPELKRVAADFGLNDYLTFRLVRDYVYARYPDAHVTSLTALEHYLLANMGYDVRIAVDNVGAPLLLIPFDHQVYARAYMPLGASRYYVFPPDGYELNPESNISTCRLPADGNPGRTMDLTIRGLMLPDKPVDFNVTFEDITLRGRVNENVMKVVYNYPQMPIGDYAVSTLLPDLRDDLTRQLKSQLAGLGERQAVDKLLEFTQKAFEYATDEDFHGFEKPYFIEEIVYYPKCDCEDRSLFYTYMLWNVLGIRNHLLGFPGHESVGVNLSEAVSGTSYEWKGRRYYISDPTYIGSRTGMCMPVYQSVTPDIDHTYP